MTPSSRPFMCRVQTLPAFSVVCIVVGLLSPVLISAQDVGDTADDSVPCQGAIIERIEITTNPPFRLGGPEFAQRIIQTIESFHKTTKPSVVRRYLALQEGDQCTELRRMESERILRAQPFLADAVVTTTRGERGGVILNVNTVDELSLIAAGNVGGPAPFVRSLKVGEANLMGTGTYATVGWAQGSLVRDMFRMRVADYQFGGRPYQLLVEGIRDDVGGSYEIQLSHPFLTDLQRISWRATMGSTKRFAYFRRAGEPPAALSFTRTYGDVGAIRTFGRAGRIFMAGFSFSRERESTADQGVIVTDTAIVADTSSVLTNRYGAYSSNRVNFLVGYRRIDFLRVYGFDAVQAPQDVRRGMQVAAVIGRGIKLQQDDEKDYFLSTALYYGMGNETSFAAAEVLGERRRNLQLNQWDGVLASGRVAWYYKRFPSQTLVTSLEFGGGWRQRIPFQLTLADKQGGVAGYGKSELGGGKRVVFRMENRVLSGRVRELISTSLAGFIESGKLWAQDAPFGVNTGMQTSVGIGLLAAFPPNSRRTWRMDLVLPLNERHRNKFQVRFTNTDATRWFWHEPGDVQAGRERSIPASVYNWP